MKNATPRPWNLVGNFSIEGNGTRVASSHGKSVNEIWANRNLIVKAVNAYDLVVELFNNGILDETSAPELFDLLKDEVSK
jgi:hypothetical protein